MIAKHTIDAVFDAVEILDITSQFLDLKQAGSSYKCKSPLTDEKTASFHVVPSKNIYKDFSSGNGGNAINYLMEYQGYSYPEAIEYCAKHYGIEVAQEKQTEQEKQKQESNKEIKTILKAAGRKYAQNIKSIPAGHPVNEQIGRFKEETLDEWQIGWTSDNGKFIYQLCAEKGLVKPAETAGLVKLWQGIYQDFFYNRVIFPIHNKFGEVVGFGGRALGDDKPKYINSPESPVFEKSKILYGHHLALKGNHKNTGGVPD